MLMSESTVRIRLIGAELRRHREAAGLTLTELATRIGIEKTQLSRMETGDRTQKCEDVAGLLAIYGVIGEKRKTLLQLTREAERSGLWQRNCPYEQRVAALKTLEARAVGLINFECTVVPGLLQTVPYARALISTFPLIDEEEAGRRVADRIYRQSVLRKLGAPEFLAIITENVLHNIIGSRTIMREQLAYLAEAAQRPNIQLRIIPRAVGNHPGLDGPFVRVRFRDRHGVVVLENRTSNLFLEDNEELMVYNDVLEEMLTVALNNDDSVALVRELAEEQFQQ
jgi:transcriptional regulator with XRE-family HTH domain